MNAAVERPSPPTPQPPLRQPPWARLWARALALFAWSRGELEARPGLASGATMGVWLVTRVTLMFGVIFSARLADPQFYDYAGKLAAGMWPYRNVPVEYPPVAVLLLLLPALPLLPFSGIAPRPDPAFIHFVHLPQPDPVRYGAYGISFAVEMLLIDAATLWLVQRLARRLTHSKSELVAASMGMLYTLLTFLTGGILQKFELAVGALTLAAVLALINKRRGLAWSLLALAALVKGFPIVVAPVFVIYELEMTGERDLRAAIAHAWRPVASGLAWLCGVIGAATVFVTFFAGWGAVVHTITYHASRGVEIESIYASFALAFAWLPGFSAHTAFNVADLSRILISPLTPEAAIGPISTALAIAVLLGSLIALWVAWRARARLAPGTAGAGADVDYAARARNGLAVGATLMTLAFVITFRALPTHYLLDILPLAPLLWLGARRWMAWWLGSLAVIAVIGEILVNGSIWHGVVELQPLSIIILELRNFAWVLAFAVLLLACWAERRRLAHQRANVMSGEGAAKPRPSLRRRLSGGWKRLIASAPPIPGFQPRSEDVFAHLFAQISPRIALLGAAVISFICYAGLVLAFPLTTYFNRPHITPESPEINDMGAITGYSPIAAFAFVAVILLLFGAQFVALLAAARAQRVDSPEQRRRTNLLVYGAPVVFTLLMIWMSPVTTTDLYGYIARGYLAVHYHLNPMVNPASRLPGGIAVDRPASPYGPAWLLIASLFSWLSGENLLLNMLLFKVFAAVCVLVAIWLVDILAKRLYPERRARIAVLVAWSPLIFFESVGNGHNDIAMVVCVLAAFALMLRGRAQLAFAFLVIGAVLKYVSAVLVPLWLVYELRHRALTGSPKIERPETRGVRGYAGWIRGFVSWFVSELDFMETLRILAPAFVIGLVITVACYAPYWDGIKTFTGLGQQLRPLYYNSSIVQFITAPLELLVQPAAYPALDKTVRLAFYALFAIYAIIQTQRLWVLGAQAELQDFITVSAKVTFVSLILITFWFQPWYIVWAIPLVALARESYVRRQGTLMSLGALLTYAVSNFLLVGTPGIGRDLFVQFFESLLVFAPLLLLRAAPYEEGWVSVIRHYWLLFTEGFAQRPMFWQRVMLVLAMIVAALLRLLRLGNLSLDLTGGSADVNALKQISGDLRVYLADPQGFNGPFAALAGMLVRLFGPTPLAALLPSAIIGTVTVLVIYMLTIEILRATGRHEQLSVALLAALLTATSSWHVSLSRSGTEVVLLPLLLCLALWGLLRGFYWLGLPESEVDERGWWTRSTRVLAHFTFAGLATGLACDLAPGLWIVPLVIIGFLFAWRWMRPALFTREIRRPLFALAAASLVSALPVVWHFISPHIGFRIGSSAFAQSSVQPDNGPSPFSMTFWSQVGANALAIVRLLATQDYSAGYPATGGAPIIPPYLGVFFYLGLGIIVYQLIARRDLTAMSLGLLLALPVVATVSVSAPTSIIEAASVLPATCIVPALAIYEIAAWVGRLPIVLDRLNGVRVFSTPEQIGRVALFLFLSISALRTFYWYFEATLPASGSNNFTPSSLTFNIGLALGRVALTLARSLLNFHFLIPLAP